MPRHTIARRLLAASAAAALLAACSASDDDAATTSAAATTTIEGDDFTPSDEDFDPDVVDEDLVPEVVDEVELGDDVIIATEDGQIPTTTAAPAPPPEDTVPSPEAADATTTTVAPVSLPEATSIERVVSLSPTHTATIAELGAADLLVGIDAESEAPAGAPIERDFLVAADLDLDDLRAIGADLVVVGEDDGDIAAQALANGGIAFFDGNRPSDRAGVEQQILELAAAIGRADAGRALVEQMRGEIDAIVDSVPETSGLTYFHEFDPGYATYPAGSLIDSLYGELGLSPIVPTDDDDEIIFFDADGVLAADPDVIVLGDIECCAATAERAAARPGWSALSAVQNGAVVEVPDDVANRWGTNLIELMRLVAAGVAAAS